MMRVLINNWWLLALRGVFAFLFALIAFSLQTVMSEWLLRAVAMAGMVVLFGLLAVCAGICTIAAAFRGAGSDKSHLLLWDGIVICIAGGAVLLVPRLDLRWLVYIVAASAIGVGILELLLARALRRHILDEWLLVLAGAGSLCLGAYFLVARTTGATSMI